MTSAEIRKSKRQHTLAEMRSHKAEYLLILPYMLLFTFFTILPVLASIVLGFTDFQDITACWTGTALQKESLSDWTTT